MYFPLVLGLILLETINVVVAQQHLVISTRNSDMQEAIKDAGSAGNPFWAARGRRSCLYLDPDSRCDETNVASWQSDSEDDSSPQRREPRSGPSSNQGRDERPLTLRSLGALLGFLQGQQQAKRQIASEARLDPNTPFYPARG